MHLSVDFIGVVRSKGLSAVSDEVETYHLRDEYKAFRELADDFGVPKEFPICYEVAYEALFSNRILWAPCLQPGNGWDMSEQLELLKEIRLRDHGAHWGDPKYERICLLTELINAFLNEKWYKEFKKTKGPWTGGNRLLGHGNEPYVDRYTAGGTAWKEERPGRRSLRFSGSELVKYYLVHEGQVIAHGVFAHTYGDTLKYLMGPICDPNAFWAKSGDPEWYKKVLLRFM